MNDVINFLKENPIQYLATLGLDNNPKVRPVQFMCEDEGKLYFCTSNEKIMYKELIKTNDLELTSASPEFVWIRISGKANFTNNLKIKEKVINSSELVKGLYEKADNPVFEVYSIEGKATIADFSGNPPKEYKI
ncbi:pyridoxamine 5'-phosphate oxidase family protein [Methanobrevibacter sp. DSM 116169]|uniref:pyridoxamine 5'-phosphate oxidase family protein n=1 Tax=Methanobrevibacter sp. DSM 116169 TaxID=3242727 RepID=UPI0038FD3692